jgi:nucleoid DNA-binding protein
MGKLSIQDLANILVERNGLGQDKAELFVKTMFEIIDSGLCTDKTVKVKGLGTFKVIDVEPRESVNVNTGERVIIEGHEKINFNPEPMLKDVVNKPFAQFETVVLNDGTDFSDMDNNQTLLDNLNDDPFSIEGAAEISNTNNEITTSETSPISEKPGSDKEVINQIDKSAKNLAADTDDAKIEPHEDAVKDHEDAMVIKTENNTIDDEEPVHIVSETVDYDDSANVKENGNEVNASNSENNLCDHNEKDEDNSLNTLYEDNQQDDNDGEEVRKSHRAGYIILMILIGIAIFVIGYIAGNIFTKDDLEKSCAGLFSKGKIEHVEAKPVIVENKQKEVSKVTRPPKADKDSASTDTSVATSQSALFSSKADGAVFDSEKYDKSSRLVRLGAYRIVGVQKTIRLKSNQTLTRLAVRELGSKDMLCYILALNEMSGNDVVKEGQKILIPKLQIRHKKEK